MKLGFEAMTFFLEPCFEFGGPGLGCGLAGAGLVGQSSNGFRRARPALPCAPPRPPRHAAPPPPPAFALPLLGWGLGLGAPGLGLGCWVGGWAGGLGYIKPLVRPY